MSQLAPTERLAVEMLEDVYADAWASRVLDSPERWDRIVTRVQSAAWSSSLSRALTTLARKLESPSLTGSAIARALAEPDDVQQEILRLWRDETTALVALVRARRDEARAKKETR